MAPVQRAVALLTGRPIICGVDVPAGALQKAQLLIDARRYDEALELLRRMPEVGEARLLGAVALFHKNDFDRALEEAERAIALQPESSESQAVRSDILSRLQRNKESVQAAREAVRLDPENAGAMFALARSAGAVRDWKLAEHAIAETLRLAPESAVAHSVAAAVAAKRHHRKEAQAHMRIAMALEPNNAMVLNNLAVAMSSRWRPRTQSLQLLEEAARLDPSDRLLLENLYEESSAHVRGSGIDRLDVILGAPTILFAAGALAVLEGWVHLPAPAGDAIIAIAVPLMVAYAIADFVRNRGRLRNLRSGTRWLYFSRFYRDHWQATLAFVLTFAIPVVVIAVIAAAVGAPTLLIGLLVVGALPAWFALWPRTKRTTLFRWLTRGG
jgi:Tfp pilus assembly protein PilF